MGYCLPKSLKQLRAEFRLMGKPTLRKQLSIRASDVALTVVAKGHDVRGRHQAVLGDESG